MIGWIVNFFKELFSLLIMIAISVMIVYGGYHIITYLGNKFCIKYSELYNLPYNYDISYGCKLKFEGKWYSPDKYELEIIRPKYYNGEMIIVNESEK